MAKKRRYGAVKRKSAYKKGSPQSSGPNLEIELMALSCDKVADVALDIWRLGERAKGEGASERLLAAWERADDRISRLGFKLDTMRDRPYDENLRVRIVDHEPADCAVMIAECLTPAVFFNGILIREAEVVTRGGK